MGRVSGTTRERERNSALPRLSSGPRKSFVGRRSWIFAVAILLCALLSILMVLDQVANAGEIRAGVSAGNIYLGGKSPEQARDILSWRVPEKQQRIRIMGPRGDVIKTQGLAARLNTWRTVKRAYAVGRSGSVLERLIERARAPFGFGVTPEIRYDRAAISRKTDELATRMNQSPRNASVLVTGSNVRVVGAREGFRLDASATRNELLRTLEDLSGEAEASGRTLEPAITTREAEAAARTARAAVSEPIVLTAGNECWKISAADVGAALVVSPNNGKLRVALDRRRLQDEMSGVFADLRVDPVEAGYETRESGGTPEVSVTPGKEGRFVERERLFDAIDKDFSRVSAGTRFRPPWRLRISAQPRPGG